MSTRSAIIAPTPDGKFRGIYCHSDGYPAHPHGVGSILFFHYSGAVRLPSGCNFHRGRGKLAEKKVQELLDLGDLSSLGKYVSPPNKRKKYSFDKRQPDVTVAYGRDRGEKDIKPTIAKTVKAVADKIDHAYVYLFQDGKWLMNGKPLTLADVFKS